MDAFIKMQIKELLKTKRTCECCGREFIPGNKASKYCTASCRFAAFQLRQMEKEKKIIKAVKKK